MMGFKWASIMAGTLTTALAALANGLVLSLTRHTVPDSVNVLAMGVSAVSCVMAFCAHLFERINAKLDLMFQVLAARLDELEGRVGDRNSGFVEGYLLGHSPDASVVPIAPRIARRDAGEG
jgi:hypothetical protein